MGFRPKYHFPPISMRDYEKWVSNSKSIVFSIRTCSIEIFFYITMAAALFAVITFRRRVSAFGTYMYVHTCIRYISYICLRRIKYRLHRNSPGVSAPQRWFRKCVYGHTIIIIILLVHTDYLWSGGHTHVRTYDATVQNLTVIWLYQSLIRLTTVIHTSLKRIACLW